MRSKGAAYESDFGRRELQVGPGQAQYAVAPPALQAHHAGSHLGGGVPHGQASGRDNIGAGAGGGSGSLFEKPTKNSIIAPANVAAVEK